MKIWKEMYEKEKQEDKYKWKPQGKYTISNYENRTKQCKQEKIMKTYRVQEQNQN
jgi:hypothetical protein